MDYFCDTGLETFESGNQRGFNRDDPLWDGAGCGPTSTCCNFNTPPWFYKQLPQLTSDNIEMRLCLDSSTTEEDIGIQIIEIYIQ